MKTLSIYIDANMRLAGLINNIKINDDAYGGGGDGGCSRPPDFFRKLPLFLELNNHTIKNKRTNV